MTDTRRATAEALENERGRLWVTKQLLLLLERSIEDATDDLRLLKTEDQASKRALTEKMVGLGAFAEALTERATTSLAAIDPVVDNLNGE